MNDTAKQLRSAPPPLPESREKVLALRRLKAHLRPLNDQVEEIYLLLIEDDKFQKYLYAVYDEQAVEGSLAADNIGAAQMIRDKCLEIGNHEVAKEKWATISKSLGVVLRRYGLTRKERKNMVDGEIVPGDDNNNY